MTTVTVMTATTAVTATAVTATATDQLTLVVTSHQRPQCPGRPP
jgi:hypothetical protein